MFNVTPGLSFTLGGQNNVDFELVPDGNSPQAFAYLKITSREGGVEAVHNIQLSNSGGGGKAKLRIVQADGLELEVL
ncbi:MAG TPA: hypothetical protein DEH78_19080 [Solibacterales bacterium]|nr:hypothetical protein [Bryobacterales bacterium]